MFQCDSLIYIPIFRGNFGLDIPIFLAYLPRSRSAIGHPQQAVDAVCDLLSVAAVGAKKQTSPDKWGSFPHKPLAMLGTP